MPKNNWFKNAIIYHILIDRFAGFKHFNDWDKPNFLGGNISSIIKKLNYLKKLGINTIWISPFYKTTQYHGYHITDFNSIDPHFGNNTDLENLINKVHENNMKIIADFVPNHCSNLHPYFIEAQKDKKSDYFKWFYFKNWPNDYLCFLSIKDLPKINLNYLPAQEHIINSAKFWLEFGFDGFRLDHVVGPSHKFWRKFKSEIKKNFSECVLIGEAWMMGIKFSELKTIQTRNKIFKWLFGANSDILLKDYQGILDGVLDFKFQELIKKFIAYNTINEKQFIRELKKHYNKYSKDYFLLSFLDNHDTNRFLFESKNNKNKLLHAVKVQFNNPQPPIIYYGTESGLTQDTSIWDFSAHGDLQARKAMNWQNIDKKLYCFYQKIIKERKEK